MASLNLLLMLILPIIGALIIWFVSKRNDNSNIVNIFIVMLCGICVSISLFTPAGDTLSISTGFHLIKFTLNNINRVFLFFSTSIWCLVALFLTDYIHYLENRARFLVFFILTLWSVICIFLSEDLLTFYFFFELMALFSYFLVIHLESTEAFSSGNLYIFTTFVGGLAVLGAVLIIYSEVGTFEFEKLNFIIEHGRLKGYLVLGLLIIGFTIKAGCLPFHFWLPRAHPVAPAPASALLSGVLVKSGVFGILQILRNSGLYYYLGLALMILGSLSTLYGGFMALCDNYPKRLLAYGTVSQIGYIFTIIGSMSVAEVRTSILPYLHVYAHGLSKTAMFLTLGYIFLKTNEMNQTKNLTFVPLAVIAFSGLNLAGFPGFIGYIAKVLTKDLLMQLSNKGMFFQWVVVIFRLSGILTAAYMTKFFFYFYEFYNNRKENPLSAKKDFNIMIFVLYLLVFLTIGLGLLPIVAGVVEISLYSTTKVTTSLIDVITGIVFYLKLKSHIKRPSLILKLSYRKTFLKIVGYFNNLTQMCINSPISNIDLSITLLGIFIPLLYLLYWLLD